MSTISSKTPCVHCGEILSSAWFVKVFPQNENAESAILRAGIALINNLPLQDAIHYFPHPENVKLCRECRNVIKSMYTTHQKLETLRIKVDQRRGRGTPVILKTPNVSPMKKKVKLAGSSPHVKVKHKSFT